MCKKKERIIEALKMSGMAEDEAIAAEVEIGKISIVGCTSYRDETNKHLMKAVSEVRVREPEEARKLAHRLSRMLQVEKSALRGSERVAQNFYQNMYRT
jgi:hypothetical protein